MLMTKEIKLFNTRWPELKFGKVFEDWRFLSTESDNFVGEYYSSKQILLADMNRYAKENWGLN